MFASSWRTIVPVDGAAWSSPVIGETMCGMYLPIPKPLSRIQLLCTRLLAPPAPAKTSPARIVAIATSSLGILPKFETASGRSAHAEALIAAKMAMIRKTIVSPTLKNSAFSSDW